MIERDRRLDDRERDLQQRILVLRRGEHAGEGEEWHDGEVLEQQRAEGEPAVRAVELVLLGELAQHDRGRGHRDRAAEQDRDLGQRDRTPSAIAATAAVRERPAGRRP